MRAEDGGRPAGRRPRRLARSCSALRLEALADTPIGFLRAARRGAGAPDDALAGAGRPRRRGRRLLPGARAGDGDAAGGHRGRFLRDGRAPGWPRVYVTPAARGGAARPAGRAVRRLGPRAAASHGCCSRCTRTTRGRGRRTRRLGFVETGRARAVPARTRRQRARRWCARSERALCPAAAARVSWRAVARRAVLDVRPLRVPPDTRGKSGVRAHVHPQARRHHASVARHRRHRHRARPAREPGGAAAARQAQGRTTRRTWTPATSSSSSTPARSR